MSSKMKEKLTNTSFGIYIDFDKKNANPERIFSAISELIKSCKAMDEILIKTISTDIKPVVMLEDIETGSIGVILKSVIENIDDEALKDLDCKKIIGSFLVKGKHALLRFIEKNDKIISSTQIEILESELENLAVETDIKRLPFYNKIPRLSLLTTIGQTKNAISNLTDTDMGGFISKDNEIVEFNKNFEFSAEEIQAILTKEIIENPATMILLVKKPDYLGDSKWEFRHNKRKIDANIEDNEWIENFRNRKIDVRPGDALKVTALIKEIYDNNNEIIDVKYSIIKVFSVMQDPNYTQLNYLDNNKD